MKYVTNKKQYFLNLRSYDAKTETNALGNRYKFSWNISNINVSKNAKMAVSNFVHDVVAGVPRPFIIRCHQVKNQQYDSYGGYGGLIYANNENNSKFEKTYFPLTLQNLDIITLEITDSVQLLNSGIANTKHFYIQLEVIDYDEEEVNPALMPSYTKDSLTYHYPNSSTVIPAKGI